MDEAEWISGTEGQVWITYQRGSQLLERVIEQQLRESAGLSHPEFEILSRLAATPEHRLRMGALAALLISPKTRLNYQVNQLVARGLVTREPHPTDRRGLNTVITPEGLRVFSLAVPGLVETVRSHVFGILSPRERSSLHAIMTRIADNIDPTICL
ncbi:DNA-binding MarR family transcriptional regulator [Nakamurella sp. UYEF19]|uniref:MarR family winged helix-turn-helix transcriptional regulator n=1 Tax=Nakamurella sp. UYEF19 TaxID=1756392 RepID=UPI0033937755